MGIATSNVREIMEIAVGEDDKEAVPGDGTAAGLLLAEEEILVRGLGLEDDSGKTIEIEEEEINKAVLELFEILPQLPHLIYLASLLYFREIYSAPLDRRKGMES